MIRSEVTLGAIETMVGPTGVVFSTYIPGPWDGRYRDPYTISIHVSEGTVDIGAIHQNAIDKWENQA